MVPQKIDLTDLRAELNLGSFPYYWLIRVNSRYLKYMEQTLNELNFDNSRRRILFTISTENDLSISEIVGYTDMKISTVTKLVYRLEHEGYLTTYTSPQDRRVTQVVITQQGIDKVREIYRDTKPMLAKSLEGLTEDEIDTFNATLKKIFNNLPE